MTVVQAGRYPPGMWFDSTDVTFKTNLYGRCFPRSDRKSLTRHDGFVNKNQPDSQNMRSVTVSGGCIHEAIESDIGTNGGSTPSRARHWQKPGIDVAVASPVERRDTTILDPIEQHLERPQEVGCPQT